MGESTVYKKLLDVQAKLKAPKNQYNSFGKYNYRSCEDILESVKPLLKDFGLALRISDEIKLIGERYYVYSTAEVIDIETGEKESSTAYAREDETIKGMSSSQITGSVSSYARKYALNGLFCIDDTKDSDSLKPPKEKSPKNTQKPLEQTQSQHDINNTGLISEAQRKRLYALAKANQELLKNIVGQFGYTNTKDIKTYDYEKIAAEIEKAVK